MDQEILVLMDANIRWIHIRNLPVPIGGYWMDSMHYSSAYGCTCYMGSYMHHSGTYRCICYMDACMRDSATYDCIFGMGL